MTRQHAVWTYAIWFQGPFGHWWYNFLEGTVATKVCTLYFKCPPNLYIYTVFYCIINYSYSAYC